MISLSTIIWSIFGISLWKLRNRSFLFYLLGGATIQRTYLLKLLKLFWPWLYRSMILMIIITVRPFYSSLNTCMYNIRYNLHLPLFVEALSLNYLPQTSFSNLSVHMPVLYLKKIHLPTKLCNFWLFFHCNWNTNLTISLSHRNASNIWWVFNKQ